MVVHNGVDDDKFYPCKTCGWEMRQEHNIPDSAFVVTFVGGFEFNKGISYLKKIIEYMKDNKNIWFAVRSSLKGKDLPEGQKWLMNTDRVVYIPHGNDMPEFYNMGDVHLMTSTYDPMPLTCLEAMSCAKPIIVPNTGGHAEAVIHEKSGFIVQDYKNIYEYIKFIKMLQKDKKLRAKIGKGARKRILEKFTLNHMGQNTILAYMTILHMQHRDR